MPAKCVLVWQNKCSVPVGGAAPEHALPHKLLSNIKMNEREKCRTQSYMYPNSRLSITLKPSLSIMIICKRK